MTKMPTINICPASIPRLKENKGPVMEFSLDNIDRSKYEKPSP